MDFNDLYYASLNILIDTTLIAMTQNAEIKIIRKTKKISSLPYSDIWTRQIPIEKAEWFFSGKNLLVRPSDSHNQQSYDDMLHEMINNNEPFKIAFKPYNDVGRSFKYGNGLITLLNSESLEQDNKLQYTFSGVGFGPLNTSTIS